jgi:ribosome-binding factor A
VSERTARLDELLREEISGIISREIQDPRIGFVTVTDVEVTSDLSHATVWVSVIGGEQERRDSLRALSGAMPFVRRRLGELRLKRIPMLHLKHDDTAERGTRLLQILEDLEAGTVPDGAVPGETLPTPGPVREPDEAVPPPAVKRTRRAQAARSGRATGRRTEPRRTQRGR